MTVEYQITWKDKKENKHLAVGFYDIGTKEIMFNFTKEEFQELLKELGVRSRFKAVR